MNCPACAAPVPDNARFCANCGRALVAAEDQRRVVTVLFADLVGFTTMSERLDPEQVKNIVDRCFDRLGEDIAAFGGQVDKVVGDAIIALFGAPTAHEDDAERAVRAGLKMQETLRREAESTGVDLRMRIGVNSGLVLVGSMQVAGSVTAMGDVVNTASRLQTAARPGEVLVGPATHQATSRVIAYEERGLTHPKGREEPVPTWLALAPILPPGHRVRREGVELIGRHHELGLLRHTIDTAFAHERAALVLLVGDVGLGKSRLASEAADWARESHGALVREGRCMPYGEANVWWPVTEGLRQGLGIDDTHDIDDARKALRHQLDQLVGDGAADAELERTTDGLLGLLGFDARPGQDPVVAREEAGRALGVYTAINAARRPLIMQFSDLHFADDAVLTLIDDVLEQVVHHRAVVVATARPTLLERWVPRLGRHHALVLHIDALDREGTAQLFAALVGHPVPSEVSDALFERSGGNPFFVEELASLLDGGESISTPRQVAAMPDTLRGLVAARLDDLDPDARSVLQDAAVIGKRGPVEGLWEMATHLKRGLDVDAVLASLVVDEIIEIDGTNWAFRSDLVRDVAYQAITKADRVGRHLGIAKWLEPLADPEVRSPWVVNQLAHHYAAASKLVRDLGGTDRVRGVPQDVQSLARRWVVEAADQARRDQALPTAQRLYGQALSLFEVLPPPVDSDVAPTAVEVEVMAEVMNLHGARATVAAEAWDLTAAQGNLSRALDLAHRLDDDDVKARLLIVQGDLEQKQGDLDRAVETLTGAAEAFARLGDDAGRAEALRQRAMSQILGARFTDAEASASEALDSFARVGDDVGQAWARQNLGWVALVTGRPQEAEKHVRRAIDTFTEVADTRGLAWSLGLLAWIHFVSRRPTEAAELAENVLTEARSRRDRWATAMMLTLVASVRLWSGRTKESLELASESVEIFRTIGDTAGEDQAVAVLARALAVSGRVDQAVDLLPPGGLEPLLTEGPGRFGRLALLAVSVQAGEPARVGSVLEDPQVIEAGGDEAWVLLGLWALQTGDVEVATRHLTAGPGDGEASSQRLSARALLSAVTGACRSEDLLELIGARPEATYLDAAMASVAAALEAARRGALVPSASHLGAARSHAAEAEDRLTEAIVEHAAALIAEHLGQRDAAGRHARAGDLLDAAGISASGWTAVFRSALAENP